MTIKSKKVKTSKIKKKNITKTKLYKQGKIKPKKHKAPSIHIQSKQTVKNEETKNTATLDGESLMGMIDPKDLAYLKKAVSDPSYSFYNSQVSNSSKIKRKKRKKNDEGRGTIEDEYEKEILPENQKPKRTRHLLPVKTAEGLVRRTVEVEVSDEEKSAKEEATEESLEDEEGESLPDLEEDVDLSHPLSTAEILARREQLVTQYKFRIGLLASGLLEDPQGKVKNISLLLDTMNESKPEVRLTVQKLVLLSLTEVFKDILPAYQLKQQEDSTIKLKKGTKVLRNFEKSLLKGYRLFLMKLEKLAKVLVKKRGDTRVRSDQVLRLGELSLSCVCELLVRHPYFNYNRNVVQMLTPFLDNSKMSIRQTVANCFTTVFKEDKRAEITLDIVRRINHLVKSRSHSVHKEVIDVLLALRIKDVNLDQEKEAEIKQKKFMTHKQKLLAMSKRERKRSKKLEELEKELLETKAEENKENKQKNLTEVMKVVFTIYFRILKKAPSSKVLSSALEGLAKFAHCINLEFFSDLVSVLDDLMDAGTLRYREKLHCVQTVFAILSGQGEVLNIDPNRFYTHLYNNLFQVQAGKSHDDVRIVLRILEVVLIQRRKKVTQQRLLAFTKRLSILATQLMHNGAIGSLSIIRRVMQLGMGADVLLDTDCSQGQGVYNPDLEEPEHCNAASTALWELTILKRHYHPTVRMVAHHVISNDNNHVSQLPTEIAKLDSVQLFEYFDPSLVVFKPAVPPPAKNITGVVKLKEDSPFVKNLTRSISSSVSTDALSSLHKDIHDSRNLKEEHRIKRIKEENV